VPALIRHAGLRDRRPVIGASGDRHRHTQRANIAQRHIGAAIDEGVAVERPTLVQTSCTDYDQRVQRQASLWVITLTNDEREHP